MLAHPISFALKRSVLLVRQGRTGSWVCAKQERKQTVLRHPVHDTFTDPICNNTIFLSLLC